MKYLFTILIFFISFLLGGCNFPYRTSTTEPSALPNNSSIRVTPSLEIVWEGKTYIATKGLYKGTGVDLLGQIQGNQIYKRKGDLKLDSILVKIAPDTYQIYQLKE